MGLFRIIFSFFSSRGLAGKRNSLMSWLTPALITAIFSTALLAFINLYIYRQDKEIFLLIWTVSWAAYFLHLTLELALLLVPDLKLFLTFSQIFSLSSSILLIWGTYIFVGKKLHIIWRAIFAFGYLWILINVPLRLGFFLSDISNLYDPCCRLYPDRIYYIKIQRIRQNSHSSCSGFYPLGNS